jgi:ADP-ribose pyrophosphatase YjhB (NUDIX family)
VSDPGRRMLSFDIGSNRFQFRTAGIAVREGHVLVCREDEDAYQLLPGGRVELGERSDEALLREIAEETGSAAQLDGLAFSVENHFVRDGIGFHEIGRYYRISFADDFPFAPGSVAMAREDEGHLLTFSWVRVTPSALEAAGLLPAWLRGRMEVLPGAAEHLIIDEREPAIG